MVTQSPRVIVKCTRNFSNHVLYIPYFIDFRYCSFCGKVVFWQLSKSYCVPCGVAVVEVRIMASLKIMALF